MDDAESLYRRADLVAWLMAKLNEAEAHAEEPAVIAVYGELLGELERDEGPEHVRVLDDGRIVPSDYDW